MTTKRPSIFQPDHNGKMRTVPITPGMKVSHLAHNDGRAIEHDAHVAKGAERKAGIPFVGGKVPFSGAKGAGIDPRVGGKPKNQNVVPVAAGMHRMKDGAPVPASTHSYLDSMTGTVVPGTPKTAPGWGSGNVRTGNPLVKAPGPKIKQERVPLSFGMKPRTDDQKIMHELGEAILEQAFSAACTDDRMAHGRGRDGKLLPQGVQED
ncbi:MAG: hypothetical protein ACRECV_02095 [Xanthobacteraceae bacterium]